MVLEWEGSGKAKFLASLKLPINKIKITLLVAHKFSLVLECKSASVDLKFKFCQTDVTQKYTRSQLWWRSSPSNDLGLGLGLGGLGNELRVRVGVKVRVEVRVRTRVRVTLLSV